MPSVVLDIKLRDKVSIEALVDVDIVLEEVAVTIFAAECSNLALFRILRYIIIIKKSLEVSDYKIEVAIVVVGSAV